LIIWTRARFGAGHAALRAGGMPVQSARRAGGVQANAAVLTSTEGMGGFSLPGAVRRFARAQIGLVSQAELVLRMGGPCAATRKRERERERERENTREWETRM